MDSPHDLRYTQSTSGPRGRMAASASGSPTSRRTRLATSCTSTFPEVGAEVEAGRPLGEVESTKSVSDIFSPVSGTVIERNPLVEERPSS